MSAMAPEPLTIASLPSEVGFLPRSSRSALSTADGSRLPDPPVGPESSSDAVVASSCRGRPTLPRPRPSPGAVPHLPSRRRPRPPPRPGVLPPQCPIFHAVTAMPVHGNGRTGSAPSRGPVRLRSGRPRDPGSRPASGVVHPVPPQPSGRESTRQTTLSATTWQPATSRADLARDAA